MLESSKRLSAKEVERLFASNTRVRGKYIELVYTKADDAKAAAIVSKKVATTAVQRNYHRRRIYHALRNKWHLISTQVHLGVVLAPSGAQISFAELEAQLERLLEQLPQ